MHQSVRHIDIDLKLLVVLQGYKATIIFQFGVTATKHLTALLQFLTFQRI
jgi:hypothetical protein